MQKIWSIQSDNDKNKRYFVEHWLFFSLFFKQKTKPYFKKSNFGCFHFNVNMAQFTPRVIRLQVVRQDRLIFTQFFLLMREGTAVGLSWSPCNLLCCDYLLISNLFQAWLTWIFYLNYNYCWRQTNFTWLSV